MAKKGMKRQDYTHTHPKNDISPVPELSGSAKHTKEKANPIVSGTAGTDTKVFHNSKKS